MSDMGIDLGGRFGMNTRAGNREARRVAEAEARGEGPGNREAAQAEARRAWRRGEGEQPAGTQAPDEGAPDEGNTTVQGDALTGVGTPEYDPGQHLVDDVVAYVDEHPDQVSTVYALEAAGQARRGVLSRLARPASIDPSGMKVAEVVEYMDANPHERDAIVELERAGKGRTRITGD